MSPGTNSPIGISRRRVADVLSGGNSSPLRSTAIRVDTRARNASAALVERDSCTKRRPVLRSTITPMTTTAFSSPVRPETMASVVTSRLNGFAKACQRWAYQAGGLSCETSLRPNCPLRPSTSWSSRPDRRASSLASAPSASSHAICWSCSFAGVDMDACVEAPVPLNGKSIGLHSGREPSTPVLRRHCRPRRELRNGSAAFLNRS